MSKPRSFLPKSVLLQTRWYNFASVLGFLLIAASRVLVSADRLPPDPGYGFFEDSYRGGWSVLFKTEGGYLDVPRRILSEIVVLFPIRFTALIGTALWVVMCGVSAFVVSVLIQRITGNRLASILCGLMVVLVPSASESQVGNQSVIKWFLILLVVVALSVTDEEMITTSVLATLIVVSGISNPLTFVAATPLLLNLALVKEARRTRRTKVVVASFAFGLLVQLIAWKSTGVGLHKYDERVYWLWPGAGAFWYYNFLVPPLTCLVIVVLAVPRLSFPKPSRFVLNLAISGFALWSVTYYLSGIGDRYFVVPQILSALCVIIYLKDNFLRVNVFLRVISAMYILVGAIAIVNWYQSGWFLSSGPKWSTEVDREVNECSADLSQSVTIEQFMGGVELDCSTLLSRT